MARNKKTPESIETISNGEFRFSNLICIIKIKKHSFKNKNSKLKIRPLTKGATLSHNIYRMIFNKILKFQKQKQSKINKFDKLPGLADLVFIFSRRLAPVPHRISYSGARTRKAFATFALFLMAFIFVPVSTNAVSISDIDNLDQEINRLNNVIKSKKAELNTLNNQISIIDSEIKKIQLEINSTQLKIDKLNSEIINTENKIVEAEKKLQEARINLSELIRVIYEEGQVSSLEVIAKSNSFNEFINRSEYLEQVQFSVKEAADSVMRLKEELEQKKVQLEQDKKELNEKKNDLVAQQSGVYAKRNERNNLLSRTKGQEAAYQNELASTKKAREAAWADYWSSQHGSTNGGSNYGGGAGNGYLMWPSSGTLTQYYGWTQYAQAGWYNKNIHNGIDISCGWECPIRAAADGGVLKTGDSSAWGNYILIRHPNGLVTLYAHLSSIYVGVGQNVSKGQTIGREGDTGFSTASHLHFSVYTSINLYSSGSFSYGITTNPFSFL